VNPLINDDYTICPTFFAFRFSPIAAVGFQVTMTQSVLVAGFPGICM